MGFVQIVVKGVNNMSTNTLSERLTEAREQFGPHHTLASNIGISPDTLQRVISGTEPKQSRIIDLINKYLTKKGI